MRVHSSSLGAFVPGHFAVPQNPVGLAGLGDFVSGSFAVPQNPVLGMSGLGCSSCGGGCNKGMGSISLSSIETDFSDMIAGTAPISTYALYGGVLVGGFWLLSSFGGGKGGRRRR